MKPLIIQPLKIHLRSVDPHYRRSLYTKFVPLEETTQSCIHVDHTC